MKSFFQIFGDKNESEEDKLELSELAYQEIERMEGMLQNLLNFARPGRPEFMQEDIYDILNETVHLARPELLSKRICLYLEKEKECLPRTMVDRSQLKQVFLNMIYNALHAMSEGGKLKIALSHEPEEEKLIVSFKDNGCGIRPENIEKLFDPFYTTKSRGTGMGLAVSYNIVKKHEGEISVFSKPGEGTTFEIRLPVKNSNGTKNMLKA
jgi:signal transduction histidine kinase